MFPLGVDRHGTYYYSYLSDPIKSRIWIQEPPTVLKLSKNSCSTISQEEDGGEDPHDLSREVDERREIMFGSVGMCWISSFDALSALAKSLDRRGIHEKQLQEVLLSYLEISRKTE